MQTIALRIVRCGQVVAAPSYIREENVSVLNVR